MLTSFYLFMSIKELFFGLTMHVGLHNYDIIFLNFTWISYKIKCPFITLGNTLHHGQYHCYVVFVGQTFCKHNI